MTAAVREKPAYIWQDSRIMPYESARVHILSTAVKYAAVVYEGIRGYWNQEAGQLYLFRVTDHLRRLADSARVARMAIPVSSADLGQGIAELARANKLREDIHVRVMVYVGADDGLLDSVGPVGVVIATMPMGRYPESRPAPGSTSASATGAAIPTTARRRASRPRATTSTAAWRCCRPGTAATTTQSLSTQRGK